MDARTRLAYAARSGDRAALEQLVEASYPDIWRLCAALVDRPTAEDLAQETILRAIHALRDFRGQSSARTWILAIARRTCIDELRSRDRRRRRDQRLTTATQPTPTSPDPEHEISSDALLAELDPDRRAAFLLTQLFGLTYEETATICDCPPGTIRSRVARARNDLIALLSPNQADTHSRPG